MDKNLSKRQSQFYLVWTVVGVVVLLGMLVKGVMMAKYKKSGYPIRPMMEKNYELRDSKMMDSDKNPMMQKDGTTTPQNTGY